MLRIVSVERKIQYSRCVATGPRNVAHWLQVPEFYSTIGRPIRQSKRPWIELQTGNFLVRETKICNNFVCYHIPNFERPIRTAGSYPFCIGWHLKSIYSASVLSKCSNIGRSPQVPQLNFGVFAACNQKLIVVWLCQSCTNCLMSL